MRHVGAAALVGLDDAVFGEHAGVGELEGFEDGALTGGHDHVVAVEGLFAFRGLVGHLHVAGRALEFLHLHAGVNGEVRVFVQHGGEGLGDFGLHFGEDAVAAFQQSWKIWAISMPMAPPPMTPSFFGTPFRNHTVSEVSTPPDSGTSSGSGLSR
jgi:hypothetical protein